MREAATLSCSSCRRRGIGENETNLTPGEACLAPTHAIRPDRILLMAVVIASAAISDDGFLAAFNNCTLPASSFRHGDHLRLAWLLLHRNPFDEALTLVRESIRRYAAHLGVPQLYHETITTAWMKLLATHDEASFDEFIVKNEHRLDLGLLHRFWTPAVLESDAARLGWVPPDRAALPN